MKFLLVVALIGVLALTDARRHRRQTADELKEKATEIREKFPQKEWDDFWGKLQEVGAEQRAEIEQKLEANQGNMDMTLNEVKDKLQDKYPVLQQYWNRVKAKFDQSTGKMDQTTIRETFEYIKTQAEQALGKPLTKENVQEFFNKMKTMFLTYYNQMAPPA